MNRSESEHVQTPPLSRDAQGLLFDDDIPELDDEAGYRGPTVCKVVGITYRQLDYWARTSLVVPSIRAATGSGSQRLYSFRDVLVVKIVKRLLDAGVSLQQIRVAVGHVWREVQGTLSELPSERPADEIEQVDELAARRAQRSAAG